MLAPELQGQRPTLGILDAPRKYHLYTFPGCVGAVSALAHVLGEDTCELYSLVKQGKAEEAKELQERLVAPNAAVSPHFRFRANCKPSQSKSCFPSLLK